MKLLCVGDIHLGRQPSRLSSELLEYIAPNELSPAKAWHLTVSEAVQQNVDAVLLAGDVVEQSDDFYEAYGDLQQGIERLADAGIVIIAVAGNHDVEVLPRLADTLPALRLLGRGGHWESVRVPGADGVEVRVVGWSFPDTTFRSSPLVAGLPDRDARPTIGLLHCDRDQSSSHYAPIPTSDLNAASVDAWLLGHIHKPDPLAAPRPIGYLGSLMGVDPGEPGPHGPWLLEVGTDGLQGIEQIPLAPLRWEEVEIPLDELENTDALPGLIVSKLDALHEHIAIAVHQPRALGCRLRFAGRTPYRQDIEHVLAADDPRRSPHERGGVIYFVHDWRLEALPALDFAELARGTDPAGLLARKIELLRGEDSAERRDLIQGAQRLFADTVRDRNFASLGAALPDEEQTAATLEASALHALDALLAQRDLAS